MLGAEEAIRLREFIIRNKKMLLDCIYKLGTAEKVDLCVKGTIVVFKTQEERLKYLDDEKWCRDQGMDVSGVVLTAEQTLEVSGTHPECPLMSSRRIQE